MDQTAAQVAAPTPLAGAAARWRSLVQLSADDRAALGIWAAAHAALFVLVWASAWAFRTGKAHASLTGAFERWDAVLLRNIAQYGYFSAHSIPHNVAFFPGYPVTLAVTHAFLRNWILSEVVVSAVAGCFAMVALARLSGGRRAVLYLLTAPAAVFLLVGYSETLFLALAVPAWHAAAKGRWGRAAVLAGLAGLVRPDAVFMIPALVLMALLSGGSWRARLIAAGAMCCAVAGPAAYEIYLKIETGSWFAWSRAIQAGWDLHLSSPVQALKTTYWAAFKHPFGAGTAIEFQLELAAMAVIVVATLAFAACRMWPEAVYCGLAALVLGTSTWYQAVPRTLLVLFPIWIGLARLDRRFGWIRYAYLAVSVPVAVVFGLMFLAGQWAG
jgi:hypothetical protein